MLLAVAFICPTSKSMALYLAVNVLVRLATRKIQRQLLVGQAAGVVGQNGHTLIKQTGGGFTIRRRLEVRIDRFAHARQQTIGVVGAGEQLLNLASHAWLRHGFGERRRYQTSGYRCCDRS